MQAPGGPEEDASGQFKYGGWTAPYFAEADDAGADVMSEWMRSTDLLLGRKTYDIFSQFWPRHPEMWPGINDVTKYVASTTLSENTSDWPNVEILPDVEAIKKLKETDGSDLKVHGSSVLVQTLLEYNLVDELNLMIFPVTLGTGKKLFDTGTIGAAFEMTTSKVTPNGVIFAAYKRAGDISTGTVGQ
jgi:dihydrofolate reductase